MKPAKVKAIKKAFYMIAEPKEIAKAEQIQAKGYKTYAIFYMLELVQKKARIMLKESVRERAI